MKGKGPQGSAVVNKPEGRGPPGGPRVNLRGNTEEASHCCLTVTGTSDAEPHGVL